LRGGDEQKQIQQTTQQNHPMKKTLLMLALVAGITSFAQNAQAELITINIGSFGIGGINGGVASGTSLTINDFPISGNSMSINNNLSTFATGLNGITLMFAAGASAATPVNFALNALIDGDSDYFASEAGGGSSERSWFKFFAVSPDFGPGSYMGFKTSQGNYGWLEVTWTASSDEFQILSGGYESRPNVAIRAGGAAPIPEPGTWAAMAIFAGGAAFAGWRRRKSAKIAA
jgi:hypothetical protein